MNAQADKLPATRQPDPEIDRLVRVGRMLAASESGSTSPQALEMAAALRLILAREAGLPLLAASELSVIKGRLVAGAKLIRALASKAGYRVVRVESDAEHCVAAVISKETGEELGRSAFTFEEAKKAGLVKDKGGYQTYPERMLWARASKRAVDDFAPEVSLGLIALEEAEEFVAGDSPSESPERGRAPENAPEAGPDPWVDQEVEEAQYEEVVEEGQEHAEHRRLAVLLKELEENERTPTPEGHEDWTAYSRWLASQMFGVESRSELSADALQKLRKELLIQSAPFS